MQKKILALIMACAMIIGLASSGKSVSGEDNSAASNGAATSQPTEADADATKVGFVYIGDDSEAYTANFIAAQTAIEKEFGSSVKTMAKYNVAEDAIEDPQVELCEDGCDIIFTTSFG